MTFVLILFKQVVPLGVRIRMLWTAEKSHVVQNKVLHAGRDGQIRTQGNSL